MAKLIYATLASLDGYIADEHGLFDWAAPDADVHGFINDLVRPQGLQLYGRRMYEVMSVWQSDFPHPEHPAYLHDFAAIWRNTEKIVFSTTLPAATTPRTRIERSFDPQLVRALKQEQQGEIGIGGAQIAAQALQVGLVDEYHLFVAPVIVGAGTPALPDGLRSPLILLDTRRFAGGMVYLRYAFANP
ncbi:MAG: deaminase [Chloroflexi bacterium]|nr:MAG: deaminase [Chloroflexota bacterium]